MPFMPSDSEQRLLPPYYRGCWHGVSRNLFVTWSSLQVLTTAYSENTKGLYNLKAFITHAVSLGHAFAHCRIFITAASRRSLGSVSVPMKPNTLSGRLRVLAMVSLYLTIKLIRSEPLLWREVSEEIPLFDRSARQQSGVIPYYPPFPVAIQNLRVGYPLDTLPSAALLAPRRGLSRTTCMS